MNNHERPFIRRLTEKPIASIALSLGQQSAIQQFRIAADEGVLRFSSNPCICGARDDLLMASRDRYGFALRTVICRRCGLMRSDPYLDEDSVPLFYDNYYRSIYVPETLQGEKLFWSEVEHGQRIIGFISAADLKINHVFEVGCGSGGILYAFQKNLGAKVIGCDLGSEYLSIGQQRGLELRQGNIEVLAGEVPADLIILSHVLEHFVDPIAQLKQLHSLLAPKGVIYVEVPGVFWLKKSYNQNIARYLQNAHVYHFTLQSLDYVMALAGFRCIQGNEKIQTLYIPNKEVKAHIDEELFIKTINYIRTVELLHNYKMIKRNLRRVLRYLPLRTKRLFKSFSRKGS